jgi:hypothetical protein
MSKVKISTVLLMMLLAVTTSTAIASADENNEIPDHIRFNAFVSGECYVGYKENIPIGLPTEGLGTGRTVTCGSACDIAERLWLIGNVWWSKNIDAWGFIYASWTDKDDDENHQLLAAFYAVPSTEGLFSQTNELFFVAIPMVYSSALRFRGIHVSSSGIQIISGGALFAVAPYQMFNQGTESAADLCIVALFDEVGKSEEALYNSDYWVYWASEEIPEFQMGEMPCPVLLPSAQIFQWNMEVKS